MKRKGHTGQWGMLVTAMLTAICLHDACVAAGTISYPAEIAFPGVSTGGIFDPSLARDPGAAQIFMAYSAVEPSKKWLTQNPVVTSTRFALSSDSGVTWADQGAIVKYADVTLSAAAPNNAGTWISEVAEMVYDPGAPAAQRWKILFMHFLMVNNVAHLESLWIGFKTAKTAALLAFASEVKLFSGAYYNTQNNSQNNPATRSPVGGAPAIALDTRYSTDLAGCIFGEPGMAATSSALYLALVCNKSSFDRKLVLLKCASPCNATSATAWKYLGSTLGTADAELFGFDEGFSAPKLVVSNGRFYVIVTPQASAPWDGHYDGCMVVPFDDIETATVSRTTSGVPQVVAQVTGTVGSFNGACTYMPGVSAPGIIYSELIPTAASPFHIFMSGVNF